MKTFLIILSILLVYGCARIYTVPPNQREVQKSRAYAMNFEKTWIRAVDWFAEHNIIFDKIEKSSGLLSAKYALETSSTYLDCGDINISGVIGNPETQRYGALNVTVRSVGETSTRVTVNFFGEYKLQGNDKWDGRIVRYQGRCLSTGQIEKDILEYIDAK